jgi:hypothetical protein
MKNPTTTMFLHQNVIIDNKLHTYNQATGTYQEAKPQQVVYVQPQQVVYVQPQFQQAYFQYQPVFRAQPQFQQVNVQPQFQQVNVQPQFQRAYVQPQPQPFLKKLINDGKPLSKSIHITKEEAERIMKNLEKKIPEQPIQNNNYKPLVNNYQYSDKNNFNDLSGDTKSTNVPSNRSSDENNYHYSSLGKMVESILFLKFNNGQCIDITPSSKFNISPQNQVFQLFKLNALNR